MTERSFRDQTILITGAAGGIGAAAAQHFAKAGAKLVLSDIDNVALEKSVEAFQGTSQIALHPADIKCENDVEALIAFGENSVGPFDICINNAGIGQALHPLHRTDVAEFDHVMAVNTRGVFLCMRAQLARMVPRRRGTILNVASAAGLIGAGHMAAYAASKHAVVGLTRSAADEVARFGIRVNTLCPSFAPTNLFNKIADDVAATHELSRGEAYTRVASRIPMRRLATLDEIVQAMAWAVAPENSFMTGQAISIDGGLTAI